MDQISEKTQNQIPCSGCRKTIAEDEARYPIARHKYICQDCYDACGFGNHTATNCLTEDDIQYMLTLKSEYPDEGPIVEYSYLDITTPSPEEPEESYDIEEPQEPHNIEAIAADTSPESPEDITPESPDAPLTKTEYDNTLESVGADQYNMENTIVLPELDVPEELPQEEISPDEPISLLDDQVTSEDTEAADITPKKKPGFSGLKGILPRREEPLADVVKPNVPETTSPPVSKGISARKYEESRYRVEEDEEEFDPQKRKKNIIKIIAIIAVTLITILVVGSFLPISAFSQKENVDTFTVVQGEENLYSQTPLVPKDGYIYSVPAGTYTVTMSPESTAGRGVVTIESNTVLPSPDNNGYYENLETIELTPGESVTITVEEGQHIYTSINSIFTFEQQ